MPLPLQQLRECLLANTSLGEEGLAQALSKQEESGKRLIDLLVELELVPEAELLHAMAGLYAIPLCEPLTSTASLPNRFTPQPKHITSWPHFDSK